MGVSTIPKKRKLRLDISVIPTVIVGFAIDEGDFHIVFICFDFTFYRSKYKRK
tara:strand:+ start:2318 stop:2476 length:159 start_codon:yes stop_codon:yes gene_type:complete